MRCSKCGTDVPTGGRFCLNCGAPLVSESRVRREVPAPAPTNKKRLRLLAAVAAAVIVLLAILLLTWLRGGGQVASVNPLPGQPQSPVLGTDAKGPSVDLNPPSNTLAPPEVVAYLQHLKAVDQARMDLQDRSKAVVMNLIQSIPGDLLKQALGQHDDGYPPTDIDSGAAISQQAQDQMNALATEWQSLLAQFQQVAAPMQCRDLGSTYADALGSVVAAQVDLLLLISRLDLAGAHSREQQSFNIDRKFETSDQELTKVCSQYGISKDFTILSDRGGPGGLMIPQ